MATTDLIREIEARAKAKGLGITALCRRADVAPSTVRRWKSGATSPTGRILDRLEQAIPEKHVLLEKILAE